MIWVFLGFVVVLGIGWLVRGLMVEQRPEQEADALKAWRERRATEQANNAARAKREGLPMERPRESGPPETHRWS